MARQTILIIRHADKPGGDGGVDATGMPDKDSLTPRGWQRAGIWVDLFAPSLAQPPVLPKPNAIFASAPATKAEIAPATAAARAADHSRRYGRLPQNSGSMSTCIS